MRGEPAFITAKPFSRCGGALGVFDVDGPRLTIVFFSLYD